MNFTKLSLAALVAMGLASSASAVENVKVDGDIKVWYQTSENDATDGDSLFGKSTSVGDLAAKLRATGDLTKKVGFGMTFYALSSMGLENNAVSNVASSNTAADLGAARNPYWLGEAYFTYKAGKTILKAGRQELDTPLAFTETWNAAPNTFEAAVLLNQDLPSTTLVAAYVSKGNGATDILGGANGQTVVDGSFYTFGTALTGTPLANAVTPQGAYTFGAVTTLIPMTTAQVWYYNIESAATAYWLQADAKLPFGLGLGAQYAHLAADGKVKQAIDAASLDGKTDAYAVQASYSVAGIDLAAAFSSTSEGTLSASNTATGGYDSKIYTASVVTNGSDPKVTAWKLSAGTKVAGVDLSASYAGYDYKKNDKGYINVVGGTRLTDDTTYKIGELNLVASTKIDEVNLTLAYVNVAVDNKVADDSTTNVIRAIASIKF